MSESEKAKRAEFKKKRIKIIYIIAAAALALSILTAVFSTIFVIKNKDTYVLYSEDGSAVYHAYLNENDYYTEDRLNGNHAYVSSLVHHMDASFKYILRMDVDDVTYKYQYRVDAQLVITDKSSGAAIYNPVETLLAPKSGDYQGGVFMINPTVDIDYVHYNQKAQAFIEQYKLTNVSAHLDVVMYVDVVGASEVFASDNAGQYTVQVRVPLNQNMDYVLVEKGAVLNWFDVTAPEGRYSLNDKIADIIQSKRGKLWLIMTGLKLKKKMDQNNKAKKSGKGEKKNGGFEINLKDAGGGIMDMMGGFTVLRLSSMMGMMNISFTKEELLKMNKKLNRIKKPKNIK